MKFGVVNKSTTVNRCVLHTCKRNITHLAIKTRITNLKLVILKGGTGKEPRIFHLFLLTGELGLVCITHRVISDRVHRLLVTLSYFRPDRFVQLLSLIPILILLLYYLVSGCLTSLC